MPGRPCCVSHCACVRAQANRGCVPLPGAVGVFSRGRLAAMRRLAKTDPESQFGNRFYPTRDPSTGLTPESRTPLRFLVTTREVSLCVKSPPTLLEAESRGSGPILTDNTRICRCVSLASTSTTTWLANERLGPF
jgi:hypothetical protein